MPASVKAFTNEDYETARYRAGIETLIGVVLRGARYQGAFGAFITFAGFGSIVLVIWYGARLVAGHLPGHAPVQQAHGVQSGPHPSERQPNPRLPDRARNYVR